MRLPTNTHKRTKQEAEEGYDAMRGTWLWQMVPPSSIWIYAPVLIMSAAFSATATTTAAGCPLIWFGNTDASTTRRPLTPNTRSCGSTTPVSGEAPIRAVDVCKKSPMSSYGNIKLGEGGGREGREGGRGDKAAGTHGMERGAAVASDVFLDLLVRNL